ncbi:hypothetical protein C900_04851 [Fulvivirga imtechensis AK7]|uniref:SnoaL-like domain-containing protein n=2 Tax=Fulvivirga TaxID=396811 RepID=L8JL17_9BACT|nr:hypothetical protein C900_04851 [Fulvivirga imtechensis AK7]
MVITATAAVAKSQGTGNITSAEVLKVVGQVFDGMRAADSTMVRSAFAKDAELYTIFTDKEGNPVLHKGSLVNFLNAVGSPHDVVWDEPIWDTEVRIDGNLAQVWTKYAFYAGDKFSHCGVDAFHLFKTLEGWKIFHLTDTRQWQDCEVPEEIKDNHNNN